jgi:CheY-like chemotaxis protein
MKLINILLVEDDQLDTIDIRRSLDKLNLMYNLQIAKNGEEAIDMLNGNTETTLSGLPDVVLIDINMPKMNGLELLEVLRSHDVWKDLKCFIVTTSDEKVDRQTAQKLGISGYIIKPLKLNSPSSMDAFNLMIDLMNL